MTLRSVLTKVTFPWRKQLNCILEIILPIKKLKWESIRVKLKDLYI